MNHQVLISTEYWEEASYAHEVQIQQPFIELAQHVQSDFFTMDIAKTIDGRWMVIEVGDGQVSGLSSHSDAELFYQMIKERSRI
ncbi:hypothetical protein D3C73_905980 [compost metagenome]